MDISSILLGGGMIGFAGNKLYGGLFGTNSQAVFLNKILGNNTSNIDRADSLAAWTSATKLNTVTGAGSRALGFLNHERSFKTRFMNWIGAVDYDSAAIAAKVSTYKIDPAFSTKLGNLLSFKTHKFARAGVRTLRGAALIGAVVGTATVIKGLSSSRRKKSYYNSPYVG